MAAATPRAYVFSRPSLAGEGRSSPASHSDMKLSLRRFLR